MRKLALDDLIYAVEHTVANPALPWALFAHGTFVILDPALAPDELSVAALQILGEFGPVRIGSLAADFSVTALQHVDGWVVSSHRSGLFTYVHPSEMDEDEPSELSIGLLGRAKRHQDSIERQLVHLHTGE